ncbi:hypothetical protein [Xenorhabdus bovienii]|uniref:hypothetical protein n=1 Tax=Xenorhabdus bovienii TaxID=40576 RepID=UPI0023B278AD|nr:hypothetical protein [Xenorhabdus bovienii]MDE9483248.1 hypothetical protein [Xenorhabdus bovienii]
MKFEELTFESQQAAREALVNALNIEMESLCYIDNDRAKYIARNIRDSFIALETEDPTQSWVSDEDEKLPICDSNGKGSHSL